jgi:ferredoxin-NADP reductase
MLIGGGSGVVPLMSMIRHRAAKSSNVPVSLLVSSRTWDEVIFRDELLRLSHGDPGFQFVVTTTRGSRVRPVDYDRRVDARMLSEVLSNMPGRPASVYVCGSDAFVEAASQGLIESAVSADVIRTERYGG